MTQKHFIVATAGHVDHGKSALVKALTGTDPDRLPEEKAREITIDLGFAHLALPVNEPEAGEATALSVSIIDVPGHEDFVRNMIAGLGSIDLAILVVAADDGWMPQTEEHLQILMYLGITRMVVAVNKSDVTNPAKAISEVNEKLRGTPFEGAPVIATSTRSGAGLSELKQALASVLTKMKPQPDIGKARLLIDRAFNLQGIGTVITGTLTGGTIQVRQTMHLQPGDFKTRVRSLQTFLSNVDTAAPGMRVGVNVSEIPKQIAVSELRRGWMLTNDAFTETTAIDVLVEKSARAPASHPAAQPLKSGANVYLHHATARLPAVLVLANDEPLRPGNSSIGQLRLATPVVAFVGDRFVIRDRSEQHTVAGGVVLDPDGNAKLFRSLEQQSLLGQRAIDPMDASVAVQSELIRRGPLPIPGLLRNSNFSQTEIDSTLTALQKAGAIVLRRDIAADARSWRALRAQLVDAIERAHETKSEQKGLELTEVRAALTGRPAEVTEALIDDLCADGFTRRGSVIAKVSHHPQLPAVLQSTAERILKALQEKPLDPPARSRIVSSAADQQALRYLIEDGRVIELGPDLILSSEAFAQAKQIVTQTISSAGSATVSELREALHTSRRIAVPLLERLDRDRVTRRMGDRRFLVQLQTAPA